VNWLTVEDVLETHAAVIRMSGGLAGLRDVGSVASAVGRMQAGTSEGELYPSLHTKVAALLESLVHNHGFIDGNKRTALASAAAMLSLNGCALDYATGEAVDFMLAVATHRLDFDDIVRWLRDHSEPQSEE